MGLKPQTGLNSVAIHRRQQLRAGRQAQILERACKFTPVMARYLRKGERFQKGFGFAALMQGDFALQQLPAEVGLQRHWCSVIQRKTVTRCDKPTHPQGQETQSRQGTSDLVDLGPRHHGPTAALCLQRSQHNRSCPERRTLPLLPQNRP